MNAPHGDAVKELRALAADLDRQRSGAGLSLDALVVGCVGLVPGAQYAGITVAHRANGISTLAATNHYPVILDEIQQLHQDGPCLTAAWEQHTQRIDDLEAETRWPKYRQDAVDRTPIRSILSFELAVNADVRGALNFLAEKPGSFSTAESQELALVAATHVAMAWTTLRRDDQFRSALASRDIIGQAKGILMERYDLDAVSAFELLTRLSQTSNTKLFDVAQRLIKVDHPPVRSDG